MGPVHTNYFKMLIFVEQSCYSSYNHSTKSMVLQSVLFDKILVTCSFADPALFLRVTDTSKSSIMASIMTFA